METTTPESPEGDVELGADWHPTHCPRCGTPLPVPDPRCEACGFDPSRWFEQEHLSLGSRESTPSNLVLGAAVALLVLFYVLGLLALAASA